MADKQARGVSTCLRSDFKLDSEWTGRPHERCATDPQAARDDALPSLRIPTRTGLTTADPIADVLTSNARDPGVDSFEKCSPTATAAGLASECTNSDPRRYTPTGPKHDHFRYLPDHARPLRFRHSLGNTLTVVHERIFG